MDHVLDREFRRHEKHFVNRFARPICVAQLLYVRSSTVHPMRLQVRKNSCPFS